MPKRRKISNENDPNNEPTNEKPPSSLTIQKSPSLSANQEPTTSRLFRAGKRKQIFSQAVTRRMSVSKGYDSDDSTCSSKLVIDEEVLLILYVNINSLSSEGSLYIGLM